MIQDTVYDLDVRLQQIDEQGARDYSTATTTAQDPTPLTQRPLRHNDAIVHGTKTSSERDAPSMQGKLGDGARHRSTRAKSDGDFDYDEMSCVNVIGICIKAAVDFFRGVLTG
jgi:hypothetical protein